MGYQTTESERVFRGKAFAVRIDRVRRPDGKQQRVEIVDHPGAITLVPVGDDGRILLVRQYRHPAGAILLELPAGTIDDGEDPLECAMRECREEIGMAPGRLERLGGLFLAPGYSTEYTHVYLATQLEPSPLAPDEDEDLRLEVMEMAQLDQLIEHGEIQDAKTLAGLHLYALRLRRAA